MNSHQRRKLRRFIRKKCFPALDAGSPPHRVASKFDISLKALVFEAYQAGYRYERVMQKRSE